MIDPSCTPNAPPTNLPSLQASNECAYPIWCSPTIARMYGSMIHVGSLRTCSAQPRTVSSNAVSNRISNRGEKMYRRSRLGNATLFSHCTPRWLNRFQHNSPPTGPAQSSMSPQT